MSFLKQNLGRRFKVSILTISVWIFTTYLIKATTLGCDSWDGDCSSGKFITSIAITILIIFTWERISKKFNL